MGFIKKLCLFIMPLFFLFNNPAPSFAYVEKDVAVLRIMDKVAGKTKIVPVGVGKTIMHDGLTITVRSCKKSDPFDAENNFVFIEIYTKTKDRIFSGWMNHNEPGQNPLQNDMYDVWLDRCE